MLERRNSQLAVTFDIATRASAAEVIATRCRTAAERVIARPERIVALLLVLVGAAISWARLPAVTRNTLWAEDARNFLADAVRYGPLPALTHSYAGYLHVVPRIVAGLTVQFVPVAGWANCMALAACIVTGIVSGLVFVASGTTIRWMPARVLIASITFLVPLAPREVLGNTANLHWYFLWLAPWLLLYRPSSRTVSWAMGIAALFAALTEIQMVLFVPLLLWQRRDRLRRPIAVLYSLGISLQIWVTLAAPRASSSAQPISPLSLGYGYLINCVMTVVSPNPAVLGPLIVEFGPFVGIVILIPFVALAAYALRRGSFTQKILAATLAFGSVVLYVSAVEISPGAFYDYAAMSKLQLAEPWLARYGVVPSMFLLALIPLAIVVRREGERGIADHAASATQLTIWSDPPPGPLRKYGLRVAAVIAVLTLVLTSFEPASTRRSLGPEWQAQVAKQQAWCVGRSPLTPVALAAAPSANWIVQLTCEELGRAG